MVVCVSAFGHIFFVSLAKLLLLFNAEIAMGAEVQVLSLAGDDLGECNKISSILCKSASGRYSKLVQNSP